MSAFCLIVPWTGFPNRLHHSVAQPPVGVSQRTELPQRNEAIDVLDTGRYSSLLLGIGRRAGGDQKAVPFGQLPVRTLHFGIPIAAPRNGALGVVDDRLNGNTTEKLEGAPVAGKAGRHLTHAHPMNHLTVKVHLEPPLIADPPGMPLLPGAY